MTFEEMRAIKNQRLMAYRKKHDFATVLDILAVGTHGTMRDLHEGRCNIGIRHDMDSDCENAVTMARWENAHGIRSTYYVLHTDWYYRHAGKMTGLVLDCLREIASLGHEIGLHNNSVAASIRTGASPLFVIERDLAELRSEGFDITGVASHGDSACHAREASNEEVFSEYNRHPDIECAPMASLGIEYEAYHVPREHYLSDNGGRWNCDPLALKDSFRRSDGNLVILMHPLHWDVR